MLGCPMEQSPSETLPSGSLKSEKEEKNGHQRWRARSSEGPFLRSRGGVGDSVRNLTRTLTNDLFSYASIWSFPSANELLRSCLKSPRGEQVMNLTCGHDVVKIKPKDPDLETAFIPTHQR